MDALIRSNPELGLGGFARGPPVNWLIIEQKLVARSYVKDEAVLTKVCWEEYKRKMQRKFGWEERRALQEWRKHENHPRVARDYHGPDGALRLHLNLKDQVIAGREKAFEKGAVQQSQRLKNPKEAVLAAAQALASECKSQMGDAQTCDPRSPRTCRVCGVVCLQSWSCDRPSDACVCSGSTWCMFALAVLWV